MKSNSMQSLVVAAAVVSGLACLALAGHDPAAFTGTIRQPMLLSVWIALVALAALVPLPLPAGRGRIPLAPAFEFGALFIFGLAPAVWFVVLSRLVSGTQARWAPLATQLFRLGEGILGIAVAGAVYLALGGTTGAGFLADPSHGIALITAGAAYLALALVGRAGLQWSRHVPGRPDAVPVRMIRGAVLLLLGVLLALVAVRLGSVPAVLLVLPLGLAGYAGLLRDRAERAHLEAVRLLMNAVDAGDAFTRGHSYRISKMCVKMGRHLGVEQTELRELEYAALVHDIGRTALQRDLVGKSGYLTSEEQWAVRHHPRIGAEWVRRVGFFPGAAAIVETHHEQPDGRGYPEGIRGESIPLGGRIIMGVAAFDAMTSDRPYRKGLSPEEAFEELLSHTGTQFFSDVVEALIELYSKGTLFDEFEDEVLEHYREGQWSSRALERFLAREAPVPTKRGMAEIRGDADVPEIEFPGLQEGKPAMDDQLDLAVGADVELRIATRSDLGCVRKNNEDSCGVFEGDGSGHGVLLVLADGMGGAAAGEVASRMAVDIVHARFFEAMDEVSPAEALRQSMESANAAIHARASGDAELRGMGTTCTAASIVGRSLLVGHVGDSRAYLVDGDDIRVLTRDHTLAAELAGMAGGRNGVPGGARNVLTRCLGNQPEVQIEIFERPVELRPGNVLVLCSDGLSNQVTPDEILAAVSGRDPLDACEELVALARERGGPDNITVQVACVRAA